MSKKQLTLKALGFKRQISHRGKLVEIDIPDHADPENPIKCDLCPKRFKSSQGLGVHRKCKHPAQTPATAQNTGKEATDPDKFVKYEVQATVSAMVDDVVAKIDKSKGASSISGNKRMSYTATFKADAIHEAKFKTHDDVAAKYGVSQSQISRWVANKQSILEDSLSDLRKLCKKGRRPMKYLDLDKKLWRRFKEARKKGHVVNFHWLWSRARIIQRDEIDHTIEIKPHVIVRFLQRNKIKMRKKQRNKKSSKESKVEDLKKWHLGYREKFIKTSGNLDSYDPKWGAFRPHERINVDQSPLPFVFHGNRTYDYVPPGEGSTHNTWIGQPAPGLDKRQCTLQIAFRPEENQPRLAIIFRGTGQKISEEEKKAWHPDIDVYL